MVEWWMPHFLSGYPSADSVGTAAGGPSGLGVVVDDDPGGGDYQLIQDAIDCGAGHIWIKAGTYAETLNTGGITNIILDFMPGVFITGAGPHVIDADCVEIRGDPDFTSNVDWSGDSGRIQGMNNLQLQAGIDFSGVAPMLDGGGFNSLADGGGVADQEGIQVSGVDGILTAASANTDTGTTGTAYAVEGAVTSTRLVATSIQVTQSDNAGFSFGAGTDKIAALNVVLDSANDNIRNASADRSIHVVNNLTGSGTVGIDTEAAADDCINAMNIILNPTGNALTISSDDSLAYANRADGTVTAPDVNAGNDTTAF